jgi:4-amino-4-deoxy-L-arabinose transferase-like glycosyltransferase
MKTFPTAIRPGYWALLMVFLLALLLFQMGGRGLNEPDEGRYAEIAREALEPGHSWLEPRMADLGHYDKPPLIYGVTALSFRLFGLNEWAARVPSLLGALLTLAGLGWAAARLYGTRVAFLAVLISGTLLHLWALGRMLAPDMFLCGWCTLAMAAWVETRFRSAPWRWWFLQVIFWTLALWTKATPALIPLLGLTLYVYFAGDAVGRRALKLPVLLPVILFLACPWFLDVVHRHPELKNFFLHRELAARVTGHIEGRHGAIYYYFLTSMIVWLPWWPLALAALIRGRKKNHPASWKSLELFVLLTGFILFSLIPSKLHTYTLPLAPWAALGMARIILADAALSAVPVLGGVVGITALIYAAMGFLVPRHESKLGPNSSLREVAEFLREHGAKGLHADRLSPSLGFYWPGDFHFTGVVPPFEIREDTGEAAKHFEASVSVQKGDWFIHYRRQVGNPFRKWLDDPKVPKKIIGDFVVGPLGP